MYAPNGMRDTPASSPKGSAPAAGFTPLDAAALAAVAVLLVAASLRCLWATDAGWQRAAGEWIASHGPPRTDPFSWAGPPRPWIELRWLWLVRFAKILDLVGPAGAILGKTVALLATFALAAASIGPRARSAALAPVLVVAILASSQRFFVRPETATFVLLAVFLFILERDRRAAGRAIFALPVLQVLWVNSHTLFVLGPVLAILHAATMILPGRRGGAGGRAQRSRAPRAALVAGLCLVACLINPWGIDGALFPIRLLGEIRGTLFKAGIQEFAGPFVAYGSYDAVRAYVALIALCAISAALAFRRLDPFRTLVVAAFLWLSTLAIRNLPLFAIVAIPFVVGNLADAPWVARFARNRSAPAVRALLAVLVIGFALATSWALATDRSYVRQHDTNRSGLAWAPHRYPVRAGDFLRDQGLRGPVFATMHEASYLLSRGVGSFIDPRLEVFGEAHFARYLRALSDDAAWRALVKEYDVKVAVIDLASTAFLTRAVIGGGWNLAYWDETAAVIVRGDVPDAPASIRSGDDWRRSLEVVRTALPAPPPWEHLGLLGRAASPTPYHTVANFLLAFGRPDDAEPFLRDALVAYPLAARARLTLAALLDARGDDEAAGREYEEAYRVDPHDADVASQAGLHALEAGDAREAGRRLERCLSDHPDHAAAWALLGEVRLGGGDAASAESCFARAVTLAPGVTNYRARLAAARAARGPGGGGK